VVAFAVIVRGGGPPVKDCPIDGRPPEVDRVVTGDEIDHNLVSATHEEVTGEEILMTPRNMPVMDALVDFVLGLELAAIPPAVVDAANRSMTDWLGTAIRGSIEPLADAVAAVIAATGGEPQATIVGRGQRTSVLMASLANGAQCHALDFDDTHLPAVLHGSAAVAPVVFALAEWRHASGADALAAFIAGFELETRIGRVIGKRLTERGWHVTATVGTFGAAAAAGRLLGLDAHQLAHALGIAGTQAAGLTQSFGTMAKPLHPGKAAMNGLLAALLAREGFTGSTAMLDAPDGLAGTFLGVTDLGRATEEFGKRWELLQNSTKYYAACHLTHATIDAGRGIRARTALSPDAIESVRCRVMPLTLKAADQREPKTPLEAKFSVRFCAATALLRGDAGEGEFTEASLADPAVARVMARVTPEADDSLAIAAAHMTVRLTDGRVIEERITAARGTPDNPGTRDDLEGKFRRLAETVLPPPRVAELTAALCGLAEAKDVAPILALAGGRTEATRGGTS
jgi:2-methylcitrate dehydratase PrpD